MSAHDLPHIPTVPTDFYPQEFIDRYREAGYWRAQNHAEFFAETVANFPDHQAVVGRDVTGQWHRLNYRQLADYVDGVARYFYQSGIAAGDRVVIQCPNLVEYVGGFLALFQLGAVPVFSLPAHREDELRHFIDTGRARALVTIDALGPTQFGQRADDLIAEFNADGVNANTEADSASQAPSDPTTLAPSERLSLRIPTPEQAADITADTTDLDDAVLRGGLQRDPFGLAFMQLSGGTTGVPKLIARTHADYLYSVRASAEICELSPETRMLVVLPAAHNFTMSSPGILGVIYAGGSLILNADPTPSSSFQLIEKEQVTLSALVPPLAMSWLSAAPKIRHDISSLQVLQVGGAKFAPEAARRIKGELGCQLQQVFGMAEGLVNYTRPEDDEEITTTTQGRPISEADEIRILDDKGNPVAEGERGNLWTRGPYTIRRYVAGVDAGSFSDDGFYCTGDLVRQLPSGHLIVEGRAKDQINRAGEKISAEEIENHLIAHPKIDDAAMVGIADDTLGERSCAFVLTRAELTAEDVRDFLRQRQVADYKIPDQVEFAQRFPTTGVGKVSRKELRKILREHLSDDNDS